MSFQILGGDGASVLAIDTLHKASRVSIRPDEYGALGHYAIAKASDVMAAGLAANAEIFQLRYTGSNVLLIEDVIFTGFGGIVAFAAGVVNIEMYKALAWTVDGSGGTALTLTADQSKLKTSMTQALSTSVTARISSTAALTAGTKTLNTDPMGAAISSVGVTAGISPFSSRQFLWQREPGDYPLALVAQEGFVVRATVPATGTWTFGIAVRLKEITSAIWPG